MTEIEVNVTRNHYLVKANGHANDPIVCSAVSVLTQMLAGCLMNHDHVKTKTFDIKEGHVELEWVTSNWKTLEDTKAMTIGLLQVEQSYPGNIKVTQNIL